MGQQGCCSLRGSGVLTGLLASVYNGALIYWFFTALDSLQSNDELYLVLTILLEVLMFLAAIHVAVSLILVYAVVKNKPDLVMMWIVIYTASCFVVAGLFTIGLAFMMKKVFLYIILLNLEETGPVMLPRTTWGGKEILKCRADAHHPLKFIFIKRIDPTPTTEYIQTCAQKLAWLQKRHREKGSRSDIRYNFVIGSDGYVYEGRGWDIRPDMEGRSWYHFPDIVTEDILGEPLAAKSFFIGYMDDVNDETMTDLMVTARDALIQYGMDHNYIAKFHKKYNL